MTKRLKNIFNTRLTLKQVKMLEEIQDDTGYSLSRILRRSLVLYHKKFKKRQMTKSQKNGIFFTEDQTKTIEKMRDNKNLPSPELVAHNSYYEQSKATKAKRKPKSFTTDDGIEIHIVMETGNEIPSYVVEVCPLCKEENMILCGNINAWKCWCCRNIFADIYDDDQIEKMKSGKLNIEDGRKFKFFDKDDRLTRKGKKNA